MPTPFELLDRILEHEKNGGYQDQAVAGGIYKFAAHWEREIARLNSTLTGTVGKRIPHRF